MFFVLQMIDVFAIYGKSNKALSHFIYGRMRFTIGPDMTSKYRKILFECQIECIDLLINVYRDTVR